VLRGPRQVAPEGRADDALERLAQPMIAGITTADPEKLSMAAAMPQFPEMEREHGSIIRALSRRKTAPGTSGPRYGMFASLDGGMQVLTDALAERLGPRVHTGVRATGLARRNDRWVVSTDKAGDFAACQLIVALPAPAAAPLLRPHHAALASLLAEIPFASVATAHLAWKEADAPLPQAMGFVVPEVEKRLIVACSFTSRKFPGRAPAGISLVRVFAGGATRPMDASLPDAEFLARIRADLEDLMGIAAEPVHARVHRHTGAMPQYYVGHLDRVATIEKLAATLPELSLCGASYRGVGVPDCIAGAWEAAARVLPPAT